MKIVFLSSPATTPVTWKQIALVVGIVVCLGMVDLFVVRISSPDNLPFFNSCTNPWVTGNLKVDQVLSEGYSVNEWSFLALEITLGVFHFIGLGTTIISAVWLKRQEIILNRHESQVIH